MRTISIAVILLLLVINTFAHGVSDQSVWQKLGIPDPLDILYISTAIIIVAVLASVIMRNSLTEQKKKIFYIIIAIPAVLSTLYLGGTTIYLNTISPTGGLVHWHADYQVWGCDKEYELVAPKGLESFVGTPLTHAHDDKRIHVEGVPFSREELTLHSFFETVGGNLNKDSFMLPTKTGNVSWKNGGLCDGRQGKVQVFLYKVIDPEKGKPYVYKQTKLNDFENYVLSPFTFVPPGDCIIVEFGEEKIKTAHICDSYQIAIDKGELKEQK